jgi:hypothetical protein
MDLFKIIPTPYSELLVIALLLVAVYFTWISGRNRQSDEAAENYKTVSESQEARINQLCKDFEVLQKENHELRAQLNQLIGENKALKDLLTYQDPEFKQIIKDIMANMEVLAKQQTTLAKEFLGHAKLDDKRFANVESNDKQIITEIKANRDFYAKTIKELRS